MNARAAAAILALAVAFPAVADTGNELVRYCDHKDAAFEDGLCLGLIVGIANGYEMASESREKPQTDWCIPDGVTNGQLRLVVEKHLRSHPEFLHLPARYLVRGALSTTFPCNGRREAPAVSGR